MGKQNDVLLDYFDDNERFADLCNGVLFGGRPVIDPEKRKMLPNVIRREEGMETSTAAVTGT